MNLSVAMIKGFSLLEKHGLKDKGWKFQLDRSVRRFGVCMYGNKTISLSRRLVSLNKEEEVIDTILHEIAHALAGHEAGHGPIWKQKCIEIGARPVRCYNSKNVVTPTPKYVAICEDCKQEFHRNRKPCNSRFYYCKCQSSKPFGQVKKLIYI